MAFSMSNYFWTCELCNQNMWLRMRIIIYIKNENNKWRIINTFCQINLLPCYRKMISGLFWKKVFYLCSFIAFFLYQNYTFSYFVKEDTESNFIMDFFKTSCQDETSAKDRKRKYSLACMEIFIAMHGIFSHRWEKNSMYVIKISIWKL